MKNDEDAEDAIAELNGKWWRGKYLKVSKARKQR
jgi:RNA recognition motif-containing protein